MLFWSLEFPVINTILRIIADYFLGWDIELVSYSAVFLSVAAGGGGFCCTSKLLYIKI